jgi:hypothetical protein
LVAALGVMLGLVGSGSPPAAGVPPQQFTQAWEHSLLFDDSRLDAGILHTARPNLPAPDDLSAWRAVALPRQEPTKEAPSPDAPEPLKVWWYRVAYTVPAGLEGPLALYVPRVGGGAAQVVEHDGQHWQLR